jgi:F-type H+-transporting ATPase subunit c
MKAWKIQSTSAINPKPLFIINEKIKKRIKFILNLHKGILHKEVKMAIEGAEIVKAAAFIGAGLSMGLGAIGPGVGEGMVAAKACEAIGKNPKEAGLLTRTMLVGQAVSESTGIYSLVVALLLLFVV